MSGISSVSPVVATSVTASIRPVAPKARPARPETAMQEAMEPLPETKAEAAQGDQQAIHRLVAIMDSTVTQEFDKVAATAGGIDLQA